MKELKQEKNPFQQLLEDAIKIKKGTLIQVRMGRHVLEGRYIDIDNYGNLALNLTDGAKAVVKFRKITYIKTLEEEKFKNE